MPNIKCKNNFGKEVELPIEKFKLRPSVYAVLRKGKLFLVCRNRSNEKLWFAGGGVEAGETHKEALRRELLEETGIKNVLIGRLVADFQNYFYYEPTDEAMDAHLYFYECWTDCNQLKLDEEIEDGEAFNFMWVNMSELVMEEFCDVNDKIKKILFSLNIS